MFSIIEILLMVVCLVLLGVVLFLFVSNKSIKVEFKNYVDETAKERIKEVGALAKSIEELEASNIKLKDEIFALQEENNDLRTNNTQLAGEIEMASVMKTIAEEAETQFLLNEEGKKYKTEISKLENKIENMTKEKHILELEINAHKTNFETFKGQMSAYIEATNRDRAHMKQQLVNYQKEIQAQETRNLELKRENVNVKNTVGEMLNSLSDLFNSYSNKNQEIEKVFLDTIDGFVNKISNKDNKEKE